ncbi:unnamed protein product [Arctia plantaginis]|uniref:Uncharacterized protein n=1 Tax=Arctia plantaginis TaxID=874455 RepID=A0A8S1AJE0_ARCPL|nr:unnamed protein product [Arctia plantaginis]
MSFTRTQPSEPEKVKNSVSKLKNSGHLGNLRSSISPEWDLSHYTSIIPKNKYGNEAPEGCPRVEHLEQTTRTKKVPSSYDHWVGGWRYPKFDFNTCGNHFENFKSIYLAIKGSQEDATWYGGIAVGHFRGVEILDLDCVLVGWPAASRGERAQARANWTQGTQEFSEPQPATWSTQGAARTIRCSSRPRGLVIPHCGVHQSTALRWRRHRRAEKGRGRRSDDVHAPFQRVPTLLTLRVSMSGGDKSKEGQGGR